MHEVQHCVIASLLFFAAAQDFSSPGLILLPPKVPTLGIPDISVEQEKPHVCTSAKEWLGSLSIDIPKTTIVRDGFVLDIQGGRCERLQLAGIRTSTMGGSLNIVADGMAASCSFDFHMTSKVIPTWNMAHGTVLASVNNSMLGGTFSLYSDMGKPQLPSALAANCQSAVRLTELQFSGSNSSAALDTLEPAIKRFVRESLAKLICTNLNAYSSPAISAASERVREYLNTKPSTPTQAPLMSLASSRSDLANVGQNPGVGLARQLLERVISNPASPNSFSKMSKDILGPDGSLTFSGNTSAPWQRKIHLPGFADVNVSVADFTLRGLDTSSLTLDSLNPEQIGLGLGFQKLGVAAKISMDILPTTLSPLRGRALTESFNLDTMFHDMYTGSSLLIALNQTHLGTLSANQLFSWGCVAPAVHSALELQASLTLPSVQASVTPLSGGAIEQGVDSMLNDILAVTLGQFASALDAVGGHAVAVTLRDKINSQIEKYLTMPRSCPTPSPTYTSDKLFALSFSACIGLLIVAFCCIPVNIVKWAMQSTYLQDSDSSRQSSWGSGSLATEDTEQGARECEIFQSSESYARAIPCSRGWSCDSRGPLLNITGDEDPDMFSSSEQPSSSWDCLALHPRLPFAVRFGLPLTDLALLLMFAASNSQLGSSVRVDVLANSQPIVKLPSVYDVSLGTSVRDMLEHHVYVLAWFIIVWSGVWPYLKLLMMQFCWFVPTSILSAETRLWMLEFLDNWGKWSLVDAFVMVIFMVAFQFDVNSNDTVLPLISRIFQEAGASARFSVYVDAKFGFHLFVGATLGSLAVGHVMTGMHRYAMQLGEYSLAAVGGKQQRLCNVLRPGAFWSGNFFVWGPIVAMGMSLTLVLLGLWVDTFSFTFEGLAGYVLGEKRIRSYSVISLGLAIPEATPTPTESGIVFLTTVYFFTTILVALAYYSILIVLWCAPLTPRLHTHFFVAAQVLSGFSALEVFVASIFVGALEIQRFALAILGKKCDPLNYMLGQLPLAKDIPGQPTCFDVTAELKVGFWILLAAAIISSLTGRLMIARCKSALLRSSDIAEL